MQCWIRIDRLTSSVQTTNCSRKQSTRAAKKEKKRKKERKQVVEQKSTNNGRKGKHSTGTLQTTKTTYKQGK